MSDGHGNSDSGREYSSNDTGYTNQDYQKERVSDDSLVETKPPSLELKLEKFDDIIGDLRVIPDPDSMFEDIEYESKRPEVLTNLEKNRTETALRKAVKESEKTPKDYTYSEYSQLVGKESFESISQRLEEKGKHPLLSGIVLVLGIVGLLSVFSYVLFH